VGVVFGKQTGKLLYLGVHNKFSAACSKGTKHTCLKNWKEALKRIGERFFKLM